MSDSNNTDNVEAFLFELNELLERHKATIAAVHSNSLWVTANGHASYVVEAWSPEKQKCNPHKLVVRNG